MGKPKGSRMHTCLCGHWSKDLTHKQCCQILNSQPDFKLETSRLQKWWISKGHGAVNTITSTPECVEIEYDWGKGKFEFRNHINTKSTSLPIYRISRFRVEVIGSTFIYIKNRWQCHTQTYIGCSYTFILCLFHIVGELRAPPLPRRRHWRFIRRANDYLRAYALYDTPRALEKASSHENVTLFAFIEKSRRQYKSHRCVGEQEFAFTVNDDDNDQVGQEDDERCERYLIDPAPVIVIDRQVDMYLKTL